MHYVQIQTSDDETRWINLAQVSRVTLATASNDEPLLAVFFNDADPENKLQIRGANDADRAAIEAIVRRLKALNNEGAAEAGLRG